jgi:Flp pilus assembly protein TadD
LPIYDVLSTANIKKNVLNNLRMQLIIKGGYFGAANKFQKAYTHKQSSIPIKQAFNQSRKQTIQSSILNAYGEF